MKRKAEIDESAEKSPLTAKKRPKRAKLDSSQTTLEAFAFSVVNPMKKKQQQQQPADEERFRLKPVTIRLDKREVERELRHGKSSVASLETGAHSASKVDRRDDDENEDDEGDPFDDGDKENHSSRKPASKLKIKLPFLFKAKKVRENGGGDDSFVLKAKGDGAGILGEAENHDLDENGNVKPRRKDGGGDDDESDDDGDTDSDDDDDNIVKRRERNLADNRRMLAQMMAEFDDNALVKPASMRRLSTPSFQLLGEGRRPGLDAAVAAERRRSVGGAAFRYSTRKSPPRTRSRGVDGEHAAGLKDEPNTLRRRINYDEDAEEKFKVYLDEDEREAEGAVFVEKKKKRKSSAKAASPHVILPVEEVTQSMLNAINYVVVNKRYDPVRGTSCHQCRQKTLDTKTCCRSPECIGLRGQFCGVCLKNRYGEIVATALLDPKWTCPPCRGICNCSICRSAAGLCATGVLVNYSLNLGYKSVYHFLAKEIDEEEDEEKTSERRKKSAVKKGGGEDEEETVEKGGRRGNEEGNGEKGRRQKRTWESEVRGKEAKRLHQTVWRKVRFANKDAEY